MGLGMGIQSSCLFSPNRNRSIYIYKYIPGVHRAVNAVGKTKKAEKGKENPTNGGKQKTKKQYRNAFSQSESSWLNLYVFSIKVDIMLAKVHRTTK